jgi:hypothetical protein
MFFECNVGIQRAALRSVQKKMSLQDQFMEAAMTGDLDAVQAIVAQAAIIKVSLDISTPLYKACDGGHLHVVEWMHKTFGDEVVQEGILLLNEACAKGHLRFAQRLTKVLKITNDNSDVRFDEMLGGTCCGGFLEVAQWLYETFKPEMDPKSSIALRGACIRGHLSVVQWLFKTYDLSMDDITAEMCTHMCKRNHLDTIQWLYYTHGNILPFRFDDSFLDKLDSNMAQWLRCNMRHM